jgi:hypothetical protein
MLYPFTIVQYFRTNSVKVLPKLKKGKLVGVTLQISLPLMPNFTLVLYDSNLYKVGVKKQKKRILKNNNDIKQSKY